MSFNKRILNWSIVLALLSAYILPCKSSDGFAFRYGYPFPFFTRYNTPIRPENSILFSTYTDVATLAINIIIIYLFIYLIHTITKHKSS